MREIVCLSWEPWRPRPNRTQHLLTRLQNTRILFFEPPPDTPDKARQRGLRVRSNILVYPLPGPRWEVYEPPMVRWYHQRKVAKFIKKIMAQHRFSDPLLWCTSPENVFLLDQLPYHALIYDCSQFWDRLPPRWEHDLAIAADVIFAASPGLVDKLSPSSDNVALMPNGTNPPMFLREDLTPPDHIADLPRPLLARSGDLISDLDLDPLIRAAQWRPQWSFLLLGRVGKAAAEALSPVPNVVLEGQVGAGDLPDYLSGCDILFDLRNTAIRGDVVPSRIFDYLSTGKPIVTLASPGQPEPFPGLVYTASDYGSFLQCCEAALRERGRAKRDSRLECARMSAWTIRAREVERNLSLL